MMETAGPLAADPGLQNAFLFKNAQIDRGAQAEIGGGNFVFDLGQFLFFQIVNFALLARGLAGNF